MKEDFTFHKNKNSQLMIAFPDNIKLESDEILELYENIVEKGNIIYIKKSHARIIGITKYENVTYLASSLGNEHMQEIIFYKINEEEIEESIEEAEKIFKADEELYEIAKKINLMKAIDVIREGDLGIKGYEILIQKEIEKALKANGLEAIWWKFTKNNIFMDVMEIYQNEDRNTISDLQQYIAKLREDIHIEILKAVKSQDKLIEAIFFLSEELEYFLLGTTNNEDDAYQHIVDQLKIRKLIYAKKVLANTSEKITLEQALKQTIRHLEKLVEEGE